MKISKGLKQAYVLQDFTYEAAISLKESLSGEEGKLKITRDDASAIVALVKAWEGCQERIRIHRRVPLPGSLKPVPKPRREKPRSLPRPARPAPAPETRAAVTI